MVIFSVSVRVEPEGRSFLHPKLPFIVTLPPANLRGIFHCYSGDDLPSLFRDRVVVGRLCETAFNELASDTDALQCKALISRPPRISNSLSWEKSTIYFVTFCVTNRMHVLANHRAWNICRATFARLDQWTILSALAMPDHVHMLIFPLAHRDASISDFAKWFKRWFNEAF